MTIKQVTIVVDKLSVRRKSPQYWLTEFKAFVKLGKLLVQKRAEHKALDLGYLLPDVHACVLTLTDDYFDHAHLCPPDPYEGDVYHMTYCLNDATDPLYIKIKLEPHRAVVMSFGRQ